MTSLSTVASPPEEDNSFMSSTPHGRSAGPSRDYNNRSETFHQPATVCGVNTELISDQCDGAMCLPEDYLSTDDRSKGYSEDYFNGTESQKKRNH